MKIILVDLDGPLADAEGQFLEIWREKFPSEFFLPTEERKDFYLTDEYPENLKEKIESITTESGFFASLPPVKGGINAIEEMVFLGLRVFICTSAIYKNKNCLTEKKLWIKKYLGEDLARFAIFTKDKTIVKGNYLIDDRPNITGVVTPEWKHIIFDQPVNRDIKNKLRIKMDWSNWKEIIKP